MKIGTIKNQILDYETLGFHKLTDHERASMIQYQTDGNIHVKSICENCHESFTINPSNYEHDYIIH
jgi:hypothetical protein